MTKNAVYWIIGIIIIVALLYANKGVDNTLPRTASADGDIAFQYCMSKGFNHYYFMEGGKTGICRFSDSSECSDWNYYCKCNQDTQCTGKSKQCQQGC